MADRDTFHESESERTPLPSEGAAFQQFQQLLQSGDAAAAQQLFDEYSQKLVRLAVKNIQPALRQRFDGEDVVQSVFRTFFRRQVEGKIRIEHSQQLWKLLATITYCKARSHARRHTAERRNVYVEQGNAAELHALSRAPTPEDGLAVWEEVGMALSGLPDTAGEILSSRLAGKNKSEIAADMNLSRQTIHRILKLIEERLIERYSLHSSGFSQNPKKSGETM